MFRSGPYGGKTPDSRYGEPVLSPGPIPSPVDWKFRLPLAGNGAVMAEKPSTDLHMVVDDAGGAAWSSRVGSYVANRVGTPSTGLESPFYPQGGFSGAGFREAMSCPSGNYALPYAPAHDITSSSTVTYYIVFRTGDFAASEFLVAHRDTVSFNYNFYVALVAGFGTLYFETRVSHTIADAVVQVPRIRYGWNVAAVSYDGATKALSVHINGYNKGLAIGEGIPRVGGADDLHIGTSDFGFPLSTGMLVELQRHQSVVSVSDFRDDCAKFYGLQAIGGQLPKTYGRTTQAGLTVGNKIYKFDDNFVRLGEQGLASEDFVVNVLRNSTFSEAYNTGYVASASTAYASDPLANDTAGGNALVITNDGSGSFEGVTWTYPFIGAGQNGWVYCEWRAITTGANAYFLIRNLTTGNYYDVATQTWVAVPPLNLMGTSSTSKVRFSLFFVNDISAGPVSLYFFNGWEINNNQAALFHCQFAPGYTTRGTPLVYEDILGGNAKANDNLQYDAANIDYTLGATRVLFSPISSSSELSGANQIILGGTNGFLLQPSTTSQTSITDGVNTASSAASYSAGDQFLVTARWRALVGMSAFNSRSVSTGSSACGASIDSGDLAVGGNNTGVLQPGAYLKDLRIR